MCNYRLSELPSSNVGLRVSQLVRAQQYLGVEINKAWKLGKVMRVVRRGE